MTLLRQSGHGDYWLFINQGERSPHRVGYCWCHRPEHHLGHCLFSLGRIPAQQYSPSKEASENRMTLAVACSRSRVNEYEWHAHRREHKYQVTRRGFSYLSKYSQLNQRENLLSTGRLYVLYLSRKFRYFSCRFLWHPILFGGDFA